MKRGRKRLSLVLALLLLLGGGLWCADRLLSRADRIRYARARETLEELRARILAFRHDAARFPATLGELVPFYTGPDVIHCRPDPDEPTRPLVWLPETGRLAWPEPMPIRGLYARSRRLALHVPAPPVGRDPLTGRPVLGRAPAEIVLGGGAIVLEAERFQELTHGWRIGESAHASGGAYLHVPEGAGDMESERLLARNPGRRPLDFHGPGHDMRPIRATIRFHVQQEGAYRLSARIMARRAHCSNMLFLDLDNGRGVRRFVLGHNNATPFVWLWHHADHQIRLRAGWNTLHFRVYQDDVRIDQVLLLPRETPPPGFTDRTFRSPAPPAPPPDAPPVTLSLRAESRVLLPGNAPALTAFLHRNAPAPVASTLVVEQDLPDGGRRVRRYAVPPTDDAPLRAFPIPLHWPEPLPARAFAVRVRLDEDRAPQERAVVLEVPWDWSVLGPLDYIPANAALPPESDPAPRAGTTWGFPGAGWRRFEKTFHDHYGLMDFGRLFAGRTFHAPRMKALYAFTELHADRAGPYELRVMADDHIRIWVNGEPIGSITATGPPIRTARAFRIRLREGRNRILFRLNQREDQWMAGLRIRNPDGSPAEVRGIPFAEQAFYSEADSGD